MKNNNSYSTHISHNRPQFIDEESMDSKPFCPLCQQYQQDISILQQKLMETHNKLIQQIDVCREQQLKIIKLTSTQKERQRVGENNNTMNKQQGKIFKRNEEDYIHSVEPLIQAKTELLRNDLQAMRSKVLSQIMKSNKLKQENKELESKHNQQIEQYRSKIRKLQINRNNLVDENEKLLQEIEILKKQSKSKANSKSVCSCGFENKFYELDKAFMSQRLITSQLIEENNKLQNKIQEIYQQKLRKDQREEVYTEPRKKKNIGRDKFKQQFEATRNLIKKLQEAENEIRNKNVPKN